MSYAEGLLLAAGELVRLACEALHAERSPKRDRLRWLEQDIERARLLVQPEPQIADYDLPDDTGEARYWLDLARWEQAQRWRL